MDTKARWTPFLTTLVAATAVWPCLAQTPTPAPASSFTINDTAPGWIWDQMSSCESLDPSVTSAHAGGPGSSAIYVFNGTGLTIYGVSARTIEVDNVVHRTGKVRLTIDGQLKGEFAEYSAGQSPNTPVCTIRNLPLGNHSIYLEPVDGWAGISSISVDSNGQTHLADVSTAHYGSAFHGPHYIPGTVEAEDFDLGGPGVGFYQSNQGAGGDIYRADTSMAIEKEAASSNGYDLGWTNPGNWTKYTVDVAAAGMYVVAFRVASPTGAQAAFHIEDAAGNFLTAEVSVPATGGFWTWQTVAYWIALRAGRQVLTLKEDGASWNIDYLTFNRPPAQR